MAIKNLKTEPVNGTVLKIGYEDASFNVIARLGSRWFVSGNSSALTWDAVLEGIELDPASAIWELTEAGPAVYEVR